MSDRTPGAVPTPEEFEHQLAHFINHTLLGGGAAVGRETRLFEDGYINSLRILDLIAVVEKLLGRRVPDRSVRLANFRSIAAIAQAFHPNAASTPAALAGRLFEHRRDRSRIASPIDALRARGDVTMTAAGQVSLSGLALDVFRTVDRTAAQWAHGLGAVEHRYPSVIALDVLERAGQVTSFPQHLTLASHPEPPHEEPSALRPQRAAMALSPAVCYHAYPELGESTLGADPVVMTARGRCYRYEGGTHVPLERLWDFTMREIIVLGTHAQVEHVRQHLVRQVAELVTRLDLDASIELATDPFFTSADEGRRLMQQAGALKYELLLAVHGDGRAIAAASFNHHHAFFGTRFGIALPGGEVAHSGCVAFGLERWVLALLAQLGVDERDWPPTARVWLRDA